MPSFDAVSELDHHEVSNAIDQTRRELGTRFDFKGVNAEIEVSENQLTLIAEADFQLGQMLDMLRQKLIKRGIDVGCIETGDPEQSGQTVRQQITLREGIETDLAKKMVKLIKDSKLKVQASIQGDQVRVTGKKRDDLQQVMAVLKKAELGLPLQYKNFRD